MLHCLSYIHDTNITYNATFQSLQTSDCTAHNAWHNWRQKPMPAPVAPVWTCTNPALISPPQHAPLLRETSRAEIGKQQERRKQQKRENWDNHENMKDENRENHENHESHRSHEKPWTSENREKRENRKTAKPRRLAHNCLLHFQALSFCFFLFLNFLVFSVFLVFSGFLMSMHLIVLATTRKLLA